MSKRLLGEDAQDHERPTEPRRSEQDLTARQ
ncbi:hypothetical protein QFZ55_000146 [Streptomyces luteogriseus]|nr:hypothetical protein [Streptomyces luteogriseus]